MGIKIWVDDLRPAPNGYRFHCKSVNEAIQLIQNIEDCLAFKRFATDDYISPHDEYMIELIDLDHDAGDYAADGGDFIKVLDWLEATGRNYPIRIHTMNPVGRYNMHAIIQKNGWTEVY